MFRKIHVFWGVTTYVPINIDRCFWKYEAPPSSGSNSQNVEIKTAAASKENVVKQAERTGKYIFMPLHQTA